MPFFGTAGGQFRPGDTDQAPLAASTSLVSPVRARGLHVLVIGLRLFLPSLGVQQEGVGDGVLLEGQKQWWVPEKSQRGSRSQGQGEGTHLYFGSLFGVSEVGCGQKDRSAGPAAPGGLTPAA